MVSAKRGWDEISAVKRVNELRSAQENFKSISFATISAFGSNGAVIHYKPTEATNKKITRDSLYLLDSGGQYKGQLLGASRCGQLADTAPGLVCPLR